MPSVLIAVMAGLAVAAVTIGALIRMRNMHYWITSYVAAYPMRTRRRRAGNIVYVCVADHFEPFGGAVDRPRAEARMARWVTEYPQIAARHADSLGRPPQHTFFYPLEDYDAPALDKLAALSRRGFGDVEVHYHHDRDNAEDLARSLLGFTRTLRERHGLLRADSHGDGIAWAFIHGNWALDNSRPDGRWCGVDDELSVLVRTGCHVDFTMPSAPSDTQTRKINSIYFARGRPGRSKSHDAGRDVAVGDWARPGELLLVQGPLGLNWRSRKLGVVPRIENGEIAAEALPDLQRVRLWWRLAPRVRKAEQHVFIKLHTHGALEPAIDALLGGGLEAMWTALEQEFRDQPDTRLHYVTAWEMYCVIRDLALGHAGPPLPENRR